LADIKPGADGEPEIARVPSVEPLDIFSQPIGLKPGQDTYLQFTIKDGRVESIRELHELDAVDIVALETVRK